ncbi:hypothetical protein POTOM_057290 [Populus tomentosa]|uniref:Alpha/beta-Hydrolases superfamily protein n=1 Tax=Populus tomentosa TaxID=118781 RepID=A0A8X7XW46_POPTO|nr:hypothetical protein POTOM_057290 [Populus tomentosa]
MGLGAGSALMEELLSTLTMELDPTRHVSLLFPKWNRKGRFGFYCAFISVRYEDQMGDFCIKEEISDIPSSRHQFDHPSSECGLLERHGCQIKHVFDLKAQFSRPHMSSYQAHNDAVNNLSLFVDSVGSPSSLDDIFTCLLTLTKYLRRRLVHFIEDLIYQDVNGYSESFVASSSGLHSHSSGHNIYRSNVEGFSLFSEHHIANKSPEIHRTRAAEVREELLVNTRYEAKTGCSHRGVSLIIQGYKYFLLNFSMVWLLKKKLMLPLFGLRLAWRLALASWRCSLYYIRCTQAQVLSITSRVRKTLRGSSDDIGWLQHTHDMAPVEDGTVRFLELLEKISLSEIIFILAYACCLGCALSQRSVWDCLASVEHNAWELKQYIEELYWGSGKRVMLLGHSKGGVDAAAALSIYSSDLKNKVAGLALVQSPYAGTPIASDILREGQIADKETRRIMELLICKIIKGDIRALEDLSYDKRREFISKHQLPKEIPLISFHSEASIAPGVLATMTHIAHAELPWLPLPKFGSEESDDFQAGHQVPVVIPVSAAMAVCALHLQLRYGEKSDGLVTCRDAEVPGSVVVRPDRKLDHAWMVYSSRKKDPSEPDSCEMCEALLTMLVELGKMKQERDVSGAF